MLWSVNKATKQHARHKKPAFTLIEVLVALALAALGFGVVLHSVGLQMSLVGNCIERHQMLLYASQVLETNLAKGLTDEEVTDAEISSTMDEPSESDKAQGYEEPMKFLYSLKTEPVTSDPRVQEVVARIKGRRSSLSLSAYRLRVKRD